MSFIAYPNEDWKLFDYILGNNMMSIALDRYSHLMKLNYSKFKISLMDRDTKKWTKWDSFPGSLVHNGNLQMAVDVHRSMLDNEIVIESDYPDYIDNFEASKVIGKIIEGKGFTPHYYYSGNKSIHIHIFLDWTTFFQIENRKEFIIWLRTKMINCWDTKIKQFDKDLINASHLIRCELSKNKKGFKTFLGYTHNDLSFVPYICNEDNRIYPRIGEIKLSSPHCIEELTEEFMTDRDKPKPTPISKFNSSDCPNKIRESVGRILSDDFKKLNDGRSRAMFIIVSELRRVMGDDKARPVVNDWNVRMGSPIKQSEIDYRFTKKSYILSNKYINDFLEELGMIKK
jgi:hypothetical protein